MDKVYRVFQKGEDSKSGEVVMRGDDDGLGLEGVRTESAVLMEGIVGPDSSMVGHSLRELNFRQRFGVIILAVHRRGRNLRERFEDEKLAFGDTWGEALFEEST